MYEIYQGTIEVPETKELVSTGWLPPLPDLRDYTFDQPEIAKMTKALGISSIEKAPPPIGPSVDLRKWCSPIEHQGQLGSCSAHAALGIVEYL